jgi:hypothetical protein
MTNPGNCRRCLQCDRPLAPPADDVKRMSVAELGQIVELFYGTCSRRCLERFAIDAARLGNAWWQKGGGF